MSAQRTSKLNRGARRAAVLGLSVATIATSAIPTAEAGAPTRSGPMPSQADPFACPPVFPVEDLQEGDELHGLTVDQGTAPEPFTATVLGVMDDGIAPGVPMLLAEASGSDAIERAGGIWAGMSGSPVYIDTPAGPHLVGAVAYGLAGTSPIAGITPAAEMMNLLRGGGVVAAAPQVELTGALQREIVANGSASATVAAAGLNRLPIPVAVSGTSPARLRRVSRMIRRTVAGARVYSSGRAAARPAAAGLVAGGNVAAAMSQGDVTAAAVGTVTAVCGDEALLFGHPMNWSGATTLAAHAATALFVQPNPTFAPFKVANVGGPVGTVDQDRLAGLHTVLGPIPAITRVRSLLSSAETGASRASMTNAVLPEFISTAAALHVFNNIDRVHDRAGRGVVDLRWGASGTRANGQPWSFRRRDKLADVFDISFAAADKVFFGLESLFTNPFEPITIDRVTVSGTVDPAYTEAQLVRLERRSGGQWVAVDPRSPLPLIAGRDVALRGVVRAVRSRRLVPVPLSFRVPRWAGSAGSLMVFAGAPGFEGEEPTTRAPRNFGQLLAQVDGAPTGDTLRAELRLTRRVGGERQRLMREVRTTAPTAIFGELGFEVRILPSRG
jgi:hypothetical protein